MIVFDQNITIVKLGEYLKIVAFVALYDEDSKNKISYEGCVKLSEMTQIDNLVEMELICTSGSLHVIYNFTIDTNMIAKHENIGGVTFKIDCTAYVVLNMLIKQISKKSVKVVYLGRLAFVLDTIVLENYNNKPFLNIYQVHTSNSTGYKTKDISTVWSSLSMEEFSNFNIVDF